jgi:chromosome segregation ATPase
MLDNSELVGDLYTGVNTKLNYYSKLARLNKENDSLIQQLSSLQITLDNVTAKYETAVLLRDAALEEITKLSQTITGSYDTNG